MIIGKISNSVNNNKNSKKGNKWFAYLTILLIILAAPIGAIVYVTSLKNDKSVNNWKPDISDQEKIDRTSDRGTIISIILMLSALIQATLKGLGASHTMLLLLYGFFMASVLGFMGDQGYGTDEGFSLKDIGSNDGENPIQGFATQLKYVFGTLTTGSFWRFIVTVFLDMFISSPIQSVIVAVFNPHIQILKNTIPTLPKIVGILLKFVTDNFDNVLQSFVAFITFLAYANDTRFRWAYAGSDINPNLLIPTSVIKISTALAGVVYLIANISADFNIIDGATMKVGSSLIDRLDRKMWFVLIMIALLTYGSLNKDSFLIKKNNTYDIKPLVNMTDESVWHQDDSALNNFYKQEIIKLATVDIKNINEKEITDLQTKINAELLNKKNKNKYGTIIPGDIEIITDYLIEEVIKQTLDEEELQTKIKNATTTTPTTIPTTIPPTIPPTTPLTDKQIENITKELLKHSQYLNNLVGMCKGKLGNWNTCEVDPHTGKLVLKSDPILKNTSVKTTMDYKKTIDNYYIVTKIDNENIPDTDEYGIYIHSIDEKKTNRRPLIKYIKANEWDNNIPCFIPDKDYLDRCSNLDNDNFENTSDNLTLNENNGKLVKKIDMGLYRTHRSNIENKYDIIEKSNKGFGIFIFYIFIGIVVPFIPIKFIYGDELKEKGRIWKLILVSVVIYGIAFILYFISKSSPNVKVLIQNEINILKNE